MKENNTFHFQVCIKFLTLQKNRLTFETFCSWFLSEPTSFYPQDLKKELDDLLQEKIENPHPVDWNNTKSTDTALLTAIIDLITTQENETARNSAPRFQSEEYS